MKYLLESQGVSQKVARGQRALGEAHGKGQPCPPSEEFNLIKWGSNGTSQLGGCCVFQLQEALGAITRPRNETGGLSGKVLIPGPLCTPQGNATPIQDYVNVPLESCRVLASWPSPVPVLHEKCVQP